MSLSGASWSQFLHRITPFGNRLSRPVNCDLKGLLGLDRLFGKHVLNSLKAEHEPMEALEQRVVQIPRDASTFVDPLLQAHIEPILNLLEPQSICGRHQ